MAYTDQVLASFDLTSLRVLNSGNSTLEFVNPCLLVLLVILDVVYLVLHPVDVFDQILLFTMVEPCLPEVVLDLVLFDVGLVHFVCELVEFFAGFVESIFLFILFSFLFVEGGLDRINFLLLCVRFRTKSIELSEDFLLLGVELFNHGSDGLKFSCMRNTLF
jgi:hypothetical protein